MTRRSLRSLLLLVTMATLPGCAAVGLPLLMIGAGTATGTGVNYTLDAIAYKTFTASIDGLNAALVMTLKRMDIDVSDNHEVEEGRVIIGKAGDRDVDIELDRLTSRTTRLRVVVKRHVVLRDRATATEIILQTDRTLSDHPHLAALDQRPPANGQRAKSK